ncbi:MAG TPA: hypothetical protein PLM63_04340 [bacterium]|nr:hypothetical protein [bacterium]
MINLNLNKEETEYLIFLLNDKIEVLNKEKEVFEHFISKKDNTEAENNAVKSYYEREFEKNKIIHSIFNKLLNIECIECLKEKTSRKKITKLEKYLRSIKCV